MVIRKKKRRWWEILLFRPAVEYVEFFNPLDLGPGSLIQLDIDGLKELEFRVASVDEYTRRIGDESFVHTAYTLRGSNPFDSGYTTVRLLVNNIPDASSSDAYTFDTLLLKQLHEQRWDKEIETAFNDAVSSGVFVHDEDGLDDNGVKVREPFHDEFPRVGGLESAYVADVVVVSDRNKDGTLSPDEVRTRQVRYADFVREVEDTPGVIINEFVFFEIDQKTGYVTIWKGDGIEPTRVKAIGR